MTLSEVAELERQNMLDRMEVEFLLFLEREEAKGREPARYRQRQGGS